MVAYFDSFILVHMKVFKQCMAVRST